MSTIAEYIKNSLKIILEDTHRFIENFPEKKVADLVDRLERCNIIHVTGMGKSGYIAMKMASLFRSFGTKSFFIHPSEASHGDMGALDENDALVVISKSGESVELENLLDYCRDCGIYSALLTYNASPSIADKVDDIVVLPPCREISPFGVAPTSSLFYMTLSCSIIVSCVAAKKDVNEEILGRFHPGGKLGKLYHEMCSGRKGDS